MSEIAALNATSAVSGMVSINSLNSFFPPFIVIIFSSIALSFAINYDWSNKKLKFLLKKLKNVIVIIQTWLLGFVLKKGYDFLKEVVKFLVERGEEVDWSWFTFDWFKEWVIIPLIVGLFAWFLFKKIKSNKSVSKKMKKGVKSVA